MPLNNPYGLLVRRGHFSAWQNRSQRVCPAPHLRLITVPPEPPSLLPPGTPIDLDNCAREPIHLPGRVQAHGAVLVARRADLQVVQTSANLATVLGLETADVLGTSLADLLGADVAARLVAATGDDGGTTVRVERVRRPSGEELDAHAFAPAPTLIGIDLERADASPVDAGQVVTRVAAWGARLASTTDPHAIVAIAAEALHALTGFARTWAYRFEADGHGVVVAEERRGDLDTFLGLHFPASDIPPQARALYARGGVRVIQDAAAADADVVPLENPETGEWLDLSESGLRAVSPMHVRYLLNMGVRSSMSVPLVVDGALWGLLSAHHYDDARRLPLRVRAECELLGVMTSMQLAAATELARTQHQADVQRAITAVIDAVGAHTSFAAGLIADEPALLAVAGASGAIVSIGGEAHLVGDTPPPLDVARLLAHIREQPDDLVMTDALAAAVPQLADLTETASGVLAVALSRRQGNWIIWVRPESVHEVTWGNRDQELVRRDPRGRLELGGRESFERWAEEVRGRSTPWETVELDAVRELRASLGALLISQTERLARLNDELTRSNDELDAFAYAAAHDLREPVRGVEQLADFLLEDYGDAVGDAGRAQLQTILRLADRMDGLLSALLDYAELGEAKLERRPVHLPTLVREVEELLAVRLTPDAELLVEDVSVEADESGLRQLLLNLIWNAIKYRGDGPPHVEIGLRPLSTVDGGPVPRAVVADHDPVALYVRDRGIGIAPEHHDAIFDLFRRLHGKEEFGGGNGAGLALSRRIVERHGGTIWVESSPGEGATFWFTLVPA